MVYRKKYLSVSLDAELLLLRLKTLETTQKKSEMEDIPHVAALLGIDPVKEPQFLWIAELALNKKLDSEEWGEFTNSNGQVMYYNYKVKVRQRSQGICFSVDFRRSKQFTRLLLPLAKSTTDKRDIGEWLSSLLTRQ